MKKLEINKALSKKALTDIMLVEAALMGEEKAYRMLMTRHQKSVYFMVLKFIRDTYDAEDITQESFTKAFQNLDRYDPKFAFSTWLFKIASNMSIDFMRKKKIETQSIHNQTLEEENYEIQLKNTTILDPDIVLIKKQRMEYIHIAVNQLSEKFRILIEYRYYEELSYEEIAEKLDLPLGTVKAQLHRAKELLIEVLMSIENEL